MSFCMPKFAEVWNQLLRPHNRTTSYTTNGTHPQTHGKNTQNKARYTTVNVLLSRTYNTQWLSQMPPKNNYFFL